MAATKIKNTSGADITIGATVITNGVLTALSSIPLTDGATAGKMIYHIENDDFEVYDESDVLINEMEDSSWDREVAGEVVETVNQSCRCDLMEINDYLNSL